MSDSKQPRIVRIWRGRTPRSRADEYQRYLYEHDIRPLEEKALGVQLLREDRAAEFLLELPQAVQILEIVRP